ncbi:MAG: sodium:solute symporter family protein [Bacteroidota bacterium]
MLLTFIGLYLLTTLIIGWWASRRVKNTKDFVIAGRNLPLFIAASALFATWFGSETIMGASSEFVEHGLLGVIEDPFGAALCLILVGAFYARPLYKLNILTFNDFFRIRFSQRVELISAIFIVPSYFGWIAAQLVAMAIILQVVAGLPFWVGVAVCALIVVVYTYIGGMWAVSITDTVQTVMIVGGLLYLAVTLSKRAGGFTAVVESAPDGFFQFFPDRSFEAIVSYIAAWITIGLGSIPQQDIFQRVMAAKNVRTSVNASYLSGVMYLTIGMIPLFIGLCANVIYPNLQLDDSQMILPTIVMREGSLLLQVFFFGALLSAILSTTSGAMLAPATVIGENLIRPYVKINSDQQLLLIMRLSVIFVAICSVLMAYWEGDIYDLVGQSSALSLVSLFVPLTAGLYWKRASDAGAMASILAGMIVWIYFEFIRPITIPSLILGGLASLFAMIIVSWIKPSKV